MQIFVDLPWQIRGCDCIQSLLITTYTLILLSHDVELLLAKIMATLFIDTRGFTDILMNVYGGTLVRYFLLVFVSSDLECVSITLNVGMPFGLLRRHVPWRDIWYVFS